MLIESRVSFWVVRLYSYDTYTATHESLLHKSFALSVAEDYTQHDANGLSYYSSSVGTDLVLELHVLKDMRISTSFRERLILVSALLFTICLLATEAKAQSLAQERANASRAQLVEVQAKQESLHERLRYLEEELKPENIEKSLAGIGSTHPEDLRELRRRQLEIEKTDIQSQLKLVAESQARLEASIVQADADAYHQSAGINPVSAEHSPRSASSSPRSASSKRLRARRIRNKPKRQGMYRLTQD